MGNIFGGGGGNVFDDFGTVFQDTYDNSIKGENKKGGYGASNQFLGGPNSIFRNPLGQGLDPSPPDAPPPDPTLESVKAGQVADAKSYRQNLPKTQNSMYDQAYKGERQNLAQNIQGVRQNANSRGLLYSGLEQGNELGQRANSNTNLGQARADINNSTENQARQLEANAVQTGIMQQQSLANIQDQTMSQALSQMAARRQVISGAAQGIGSGVGTYMANQNNQAIANQTANQANYGINQPTRYGT